MSEFRYLGGLVTEDRDLAHARLTAEAEPREDTSRRSPKKIPPVVSHAKAQGPTAGRGGDGGSAIRRYDLGTRP